MSLDRRTWFVVALGLLAFGLWLQHTPPGLLGKADAVGYAVCHQIPSHSFHFGERPLSLCARCTGQYLGFLVGLLYQMGLGRSRGGKFPERQRLILLGGLLLVYGLDAVNSYVSLDPITARYSLYAPRNALRLLTGIGAGLAVSAVFLPFFNQIVWRRAPRGPILDTGWQWLGMMLSGLLAGALVLTGSPLLLYPLTLTAAGGVVILLTLAYSLIWVLLLGKEKSFQSWKQLGWLLGMGFLTAIVQIGGMDLLRFTLTGTWEGFFLG